MNEDDYEKKYEEKAAKRRIARLGVIEAVKEVITQFADRKRAEANAIEKFGAAFVEMMVVEESES